jgi:hypothetical protein
MAETDDIPVENFADYVRLHCNPTSLEDATRYAEQGKDLLAMISGNSDMDAIHQQHPSPQEAMAKLEWYFIKSAFDNGKTFGKGVFTIELDTKEHTEKLFNFLKGDAKPKYNKAGELLATAGQVALAPITSAQQAVKPEIRDRAYSRTSTHFNNSVKQETGHFGLDDEHSKIPLPGVFATSAFGLLDTNQLYVKPETSGADIKYKPAEAIGEHLINLAMSRIVGGENIPGLENFRESEIPTQIKDFCIQALNETKNEVNNEKINNHVQETLDLITNNELNLQQIADKLKFIDKSLNQKNIQLTNKTSLLDRFDNKCHEHFGYRNRHQIGSEVNLKFDKSGTLKYEQVGFKKDTGARKTMVAHQNHLREQNRKPSTEHLKRRSPVMKRR